MPKVLIKYNDYFYIFLELYKNLKYKLYYFYMNNFSIFPLNNLDIWNIYKKQIKAFWTVEEIDFSQDYHDFEKLDEDKQNALKMILSFFANSDGLVNFNIQKNFLNDFDKEITYTYVYQMFIEQIHNECYSLMIDTLIKDNDEKNKLFDSINNNDIIKEISKWGLRYSNDDVYSLSHKLLVFICIEGIMFSGAFAFIYWIKNVCSKGNLFLPALIKSNEFISRDEGMHVEFGIEIFKRQNEIDNIPNFNKTSIILECVSLTQKLNKEILKIKHIGMNEDLMNKYTEYVADRIFISIGLNKYFKTSNPFSFMDSIGMPQKTNFHESRPTEYQRASGGNTDILLMSDDF